MKQPLLEMRLMLKGDADEQVIDVAIEGRGAYDGQIVGVRNDVPPEEMHDVMAWLGRQMFEFLLQVLPDYEDD